jgi:hypothetical protein
MKKIAALFSVLSAVILSSCGLFGTGMTDPVQISYYTQRVHSPLFLILSVRCPYDSACASNVSFGPPLSGEIVNGASPGDYRYTFVSDGSQETVKVNSIEPLIIHDDGHVRFSLFDSTHAEKSYDIDLGGVTHSWTRRGDSVDVAIPEGYTMAIMEKEEGQLGFSGDTLPDRTVTLPYEGPWGRDYSLRGNLSGQSTYGTDSVLVSAVGYWRPDSL